MTRHDILTAPSESRFRLDVEKSWIESSKVTALLQELEILKQTGAKSIVFSQWTSFLDLLQIPLNRSKCRQSCWPSHRSIWACLTFFAFSVLSRRDIMYVRLDGTLNQVQREKVIREFSSNPKILVPSFFQTWDMLVELWDA
jgi:DNA repair protein RAD5